MDHRDESRQHIPNDGTAHEDILQEWDVMQAYYNRIGQPLGKDGFELWVEFEKIARIN